MKIERVGNMMGVEPKKKVHSVQVTLVLLILVGSLVGYYFYLNTKQHKEDDTVVTYTLVDNVLAKDISNYYPPTPKEVMNFYAEITKCFYNEEYTEEQLILLVMKMRELYDDELLDNNEWEGHLSRLKVMISDFEQDQVNISSYTISASTDVDYFTEDNYEWARLYCTFTLRQGSKYTNSNEHFLMRKDENGHWKIYGWKLIDGDEV